jgi:hypothetical protein
VAGIPPEEDEIERAVYEGVDDAMISINWIGNPGSIELHTTAGENEKEIRTRPLKWPFTERQLESAMHWLIKQARKLNDAELRNQRR